MTVTPDHIATDRAIDTWLHEHGEGLIALRRNLHAHPELSGMEFATTDLIAERLTLAGLEPLRLSSGTGLICDLAGSHVDGPMFALRADIDALGMEDDKDVPYRSQVPGVAHACGHDVHTAIVLGVALYYAHHLDELPGRLRFIFQPAEELVPGGALSVLADDGLSGVDAIIGYHCEPKLDVGRIGLRSGAISSAADKVCIKLEGPGGHTARPELTVDMIAIAADVIRELPRRVDELIGEQGHVKLVFGSVHAGDAANVIPSHCELFASVRTPRADLWERLPALVGEALADVLADTDAAFDIAYTHGVPPVVNDAGVTGLVRRAGERELGADGIYETTQSWGGDDFAWFLREVPGSYIRLGVHDPSSDGARLDLHAGHFDVDERSIAQGIRLMVACVDEFFTADPGASR